MPALCVFFQIVTLHSDDVQQLTHLVVVRYFECALHHIVGLNVAHEFQNVRLLFVQQFCYDFSALLSVAVHKTFFNNIRCLFREAHLTDFTINRSKHDGFLLFGTILQNVLNRLVAILVFCQVINVRQDFVNDWLYKKGA